MKVRKVNIVDSKCDSTKCNQECVRDGPNVFTIDNNTNKAKVKVLSPLNDSQEVEAGYAIGNCPKEAIWGRGEGEPPGSRQ